jgi:hypothetical protein
MIVGADIIKTDNDYFSVKNIVLPETCQAFENRIPG